ncbi:hypothetical protein OCH74_05490 [Bifidobacterium thermacidophilum]|uniref:Uncharacterized protein n=1 Tax=Bifidobacterium thermacidophilum TaxID=246618 RepID=A0ABW8KT78_9BIFI
MNIGHIGNGQGEPWTVGGSNIGSLSSINGFVSFRGVSLLGHRNGFGDFTGIGGNIFHRGVSAARFSRVRG